jgi:hypothetical protein
MFRIAFFVDDKNLAEVMHAVSGRARQLEVVPVVNAAGAPNGKVRQQAGSSRELVLQGLTKLGKTFGSVEVRAVLKKLGLSPSSWNHFTKDLVKEGSLTTTKAGTRTLYTVVKK